MRLFTKPTKQTMKSLTLALILMITSGLVHAQNPAAQNHVADRGNPVQPAGTNQAVTGSGTPGKLTKWTGSNGSSFVLGDSIISEDKFNNVAIGNIPATSKLTVQGMIETTLGGLKFPDGSVQTTAANGGLQFILHDTTLIGTGTPGTPLSVAIPLVLNGSANVGVLQITNTRVGTRAIFTKGGDSSDSNTLPGSGIFAKGGDQFQSGGNIAQTGGGTGVEGQGGGSVDAGGIGVLGTGGGGHLRGGNGVIGEGGGGLTQQGGDGVHAFGGNATDIGSTGGIGIYAIGGVGANSVPSDAAFLDGAVEVNGSFNVIGGGTKNFKIDHPLDPANKYLYHAAIESSEVLNIYSGNVTTDASGDATVTLPDWFESINRDFRYQLTVVGTFAQAIVADEIKGNHFQIKTNTPNVKVSWQVTGVRSDAAMLKHPFTVEQDKPKAERGSYLTPDAYDKPESSGIQWARNPQLMKQLQEKREASRRQQSQPAGSN